MKACLHIIDFFCVTRHICNLALQEFVLTDFNIDFLDDASLGRLQGGATLHALFVTSKHGLQPTKVTHPPLLLTAPMYPNLLPPNKLVPCFTWTVFDVAGAYRLLPAPKDPYHGRRL